MIKVDDKQLVLLKQFNTRQEAELVQSLLRSAGIPSIVQADDAGGMYPLPGRSGFGPVILLVKVSDFESAQQIINS